MSCNYWHQETFLVDLKLEVFYNKYVILGSPPYKNPMAADKLINNSNILLVILWTNRILEQVGTISNLCFIGEGDHILVVTFSKVKEWLFLKEELFFPDFEWY